MDKHFDKDWLDPDKFTIDALLDLPQAALIKQLLDLNYPETLTSTYAPHNPSESQPEPQSDQDAGREIKMRTVLLAFEGKTLFEVGAHDPWRAAGAKLGITMSGACPPACMALS